MDNKTDKIYNIEADLEVLEVLVLELSQCFNNLLCLCPIFQTRLNQTESSFESGYLAGF